MTSSFFNNKKIHVNLPQENLVVKLHTHIIQIQI